MDLATLTYGELLEHLRKDLLLNANTDTLTGSVLAALTRDTTTTTPGYSAASIHSLDALLGVVQRADAGFATAKLGDPMLIIAAADSAAQAANTNINVMSTVAKTIVGDPGSRWDNVNNQYLCRNTGWFVIAWALTVTTTAAADVVAGPNQQTSGNFLSSGNTTAGATLGGTSGAMLVPGTAGDFIRFFGAATSVPTFKQLGATGNTGTWFAVMQVI